MTYKDPKKAKEYDRMWRDKNREKCKEKWFKLEEFKECWSLDNLQPLWAKDNLSKGNRYAG